MTLTYPSYAALLYNALRPDPFYRTLEAAFPEREAARDAMLRYYDLSIAEAAVWGHLGMAEGTEGISVWSVPLDAEQSRQKAEAKRTALVAAMGTACAQTFAAIEENMARHEAAMDLSDHWYLSILAVAPDQQGRGKGASLLDPVLAQADKAGVSSYLTTFTPRNISFYKRMGYRDMGGFAEPITQSDFHILVRPPAGGPL